MATNSIPGSVVALLQQRRSAIRSYKPPVGNSRREDPVTGETISLVPSASKKSENSALYPTLSPQTLSFSVRSALESRR